MGTSATKSIGLLGLPFSLGCPLSSFDLAPQATRQVTVPTKSYRHVLRLHGCMSSAQSGLLAEIEALKTFRVTDCGDIATNFTKDDFKDVSFPGGQAAAKNLSAVGKLNHRIYQVSRRSSVVHRVVCQLPVAW